ncbi:preprotein translocase subunit SecG [Candidatus Dojkabacteria bacterium]|nr:preprotein translocase subunit SecG [Candidatus Dojkabacteria bacterium]
MKPETIIKIAQIVTSVLVTGVILLQNRGEGLGSMFGGGGEVFRTRRGIEKILYYLTISLSIALVVLSIVNVKLS